MGGHSLTPGLAWRVFHMTDQSVGELFGCHWPRLENAARLLTALQEVHGALRMSLRPLLRTRRVTSCCTPFGVMTMMMMMMMGMVLMKVVQKMLWQVEDHGGGCGRQDTASGIDWRGVYNTTYCINRGTFNVFIDGALT